MIWPLKPSPQSLIGPMAILMLVFLNGCIRSPSATKEIVFKDCSFENFKQAELIKYGEFDMAQRVLHDLKIGVSADDIVWNLKSFLDVKEMRELKEKGLKR